jgi:hypothetical protein
MKLLDSTFDHEFIQSLFDEIKTDNTDFVETKTIESQFNVFKKERKIINFIIYF